MQGLKWKKVKMQGLKVHLCLFFVNKQETTKLQSQLSNYNKKQNLRKVERRGSHLFEEDREATMGDDKEKKSSASTSASALYPLPSPPPPVCGARFFLLQTLFFSLFTKIFWSFEFHLIFFLFSFPSKIILSCVL